MLAVAVGVAVLVTAGLGAWPVAGNPSVTVSILFDLGDGRYVWTTGTIPHPTAARARVPWGPVEFRCRRFCRPRSDPRVLGPGYRQAGDRIDAGGGRWQSLRHDDGLDDGTRCGERQCALEHL